MITHRPRFSWQPLAEHTGIILDQGKKIAEVRGGRLRNAILKPGGRTIVEENIGLRLFWMQYADHQKPGRSADEVLNVKVIEDEPEKIVLEIVSTNSENSIESRYTLNLTYREDLQTYYYLFDARLTVLAGKSWPVTHNPLNGELEYCNFYPKGVFDRPKLWQNCSYEADDSTIVRVPHHHLPTSDKVFKPFRRGGRVFYLLEDENPVVQLLGETAGDTAAGLLRAMPGLCAYMFDTHLAYRVCPNPEPVLLESGRKFTANFALYQVGREDGSKILQESSYTRPPEVRTLPVFVDGVNTFADTIDDVDGDLLPVWSWSMEAGEKWDSLFNEHVDGLEFALDRTLGHTDSSSLKIESRMDTSARWAYTALGGAFFQKEFSDGKKYRLRGFLKTEKLRGRGAGLGIRLHREDRSNPESVFDWSRYEHFHSVKIVGTNDWTELEVITPRISPKPDRVHLLLEQTGSGTSWFDDVEFGEID